MTFRVHGNARPLPVRYERERRALPLVSRQERLQARARLFRRASFRRVRPPEPPGDAPHVRVDHEPRAFVAERHGRDEPREFGPDPGQTLQVTHRARRFPSERRRDHGGAPLHVSRLGVFEVERLDRLGDGLRRRGVHRAERDA